MDSCQLYLGPDWAMVASNATTLEGGYAAGEPILKAAKDATDIAKAVLASLNTPQTHRIPQAECDDDAFTAKVCEISGIPRWSSFQKAVTYFLVEKDKHGLSITPGPRRGRSFVFDARGIRRCDVNERSLAHLIADILAV